MTTMRLTFEYMISVFIPYVMSFANDEMGQDLIEYALVAALVGLGAVTAIKGVGTKLSSVFTSIGTSVSSAV